MEKSIEVEIPKGYEIDKELSTFTKIVFKERKLPETWKELKVVKGWYINNDAETVKVKKGEPIYYSSKKLFPTLELAEASLALSQLLQLRERYNDGWKPNWVNHNEKYCIHVYENRLETEISYSSNTVFAFKTKELCNEFLDNFLNLLNVAKPLL